MVEFDDDERRVGYDPTVYGEYGDGVVTWENVKMYRPKWEYFFLDYDTTSNDVPRTTKSTFEQLGDAGWELVCTERIDEGRLYMKNRAIFKRIKEISE